MKSLREYAMTKKVPLNRTFRDKWLRALRKPPKGIKQAQGYALGIGGNGKARCCGLGLAPIAMGGVPVQDGNGGAYYRMPNGELMASLSMVIRKYLSQFACSTTVPFAFEDLLSQVVRMNDGEGAKFSEIADFIQANTRRC